MMFSILTKKKKVLKERKPIDLPEIKLEELNPIDLAIMLKKGSIIWAWFSLIDKFNPTTLLNLCDNNLDGFAVFCEKKVFC